MIGIRVIRNKTRIKQSNHIKRIRSSIKDVTPLIYSFQHHYCDLNKMFKLKNRIFQLSNDFCQKFMKKLPGFKIYFADKVLTLRQYL